MNIHEIAINKIKGEIPGVRVKHFAKSLRGLCEEAPIIRVVPDAFKICYFCQVVFAYEVEVTNHLSYKKLVSYGHLWFDLDGELWDLFVVPVDRYGIKKEPFDLCRYFYESLREKSKEST